MFSYSDLCTQILSWLFVGSKGSTHISDIVRVGLATEISLHCLWRWQGIRWRFMSPRSISGKTLGENKRGLTELWVWKAWFLELLRWKYMGPVIFGSFRNLGPALLLLGPATRPRSSGSTCRFSTSQRPPTDSLQLQVFLFYFWPKNFGCLKWVFYNFWHYCTSGTI